MTALLGILPVAEQASWSLFRDRGAAGAESVFNPPEQGVDPTAGRGSLSQEIEAISTRRRTLVNS